MNKKIFVFLLCVFITNSGFGELVCDENIVNYYAKYTPKTYTCGAGYFLPANADGCETCPNGYTCTGGTYEFDSERSQGATLNAIPNDTMAKVCADNFPIDIYAVYDPNVINLNYDDGNGNITSLTCDYGDVVNVPSVEPTRVGYTFSGWVVRSDNNE